jgi:hypothetical protein
MMAAHLNACYFLDYILFNTIYFNNLHDNTSNSYSNNRTSRVTFDGF